MMFKILTINPGSTSTKIGIFEDEKKIFEESIPFDESKRKKYRLIADQLDCRFADISEALSRVGFSVSGFDAVSARGGLLAPVISGTFVVNDEMERDVREARRGEHASNLGALLAKKIATSSGCRAFIVDPVSVDELTEVARISGAPEMERTSLVHALNQKAVARITAAKLGKEYQDCRFLVAHLGTGVTIGAHQEGRIIDVVGAQQDGPFSLERAGGLPVDSLVRLCYSGKYSEEELMRKLMAGWGLVAYLGTRDLREVQKAAETDDRAKLVYDAFVYQVAKGIGELATVLRGEIDAVILTGGMACSEQLCRDIGERVGFIGKLEIIPGEDEQYALAQGVLRVLQGIESVRNYPGGECV